ncbi:MAG: serine/threonine-protein kinase [Archangium sp.]|nr:serine/threonine-protein kinase [Archangium sp.]MDP3152131.1 serine/threonine-protein kinase [Archangium sp.]MDP3574987.1 serine/threonine-protein kinase [Archangium sp.]
MELPRPFGPFMLEKKLGQGGMAEVFRARVFGASGFEKVVVVKTLREELLGMPELERMFLEEARLQARLSHRNLVQAHDLGVTEGRPWVRLDFVDGVDLSALPLPLPGEFARFIGVELALGLHALHDAKDEAGRELGIVHRDVSRKNVLISRLGEVRLADFGIARATQLREQTRGGVRKGTWAYMSPEQVSGRPLTAASDQFSLATLLVELITGTRPFDGATPLETMERIREAVAPALEGVGPEWISPLRRALAKEPAERFASSREMRAALQQSGAVADELALADHLASVRAVPVTAIAQTRID